MSDYHEILHIHRQPCCQFIHKNVYGDTTGIFVWNKKWNCIEKKIHSFMAQVQGSVVCYLEEVSHPKYIPSWHITVQVWTYDSAKRFITNIAWFNLKISYYWDQKSNCGDKMIIRSSYPHSRNSYTWKTAPSYWSNPLIPDSALLSASAEIKIKILLQSLPA